MIVVNTLILGHTNKILLNLKGKVLQNQSLSQHVHSENINNC